MISPTLAIMNEKIILKTYFFGNLKLTNCIIIKIIKIGKVEMTTSKTLVFKISKKLANSKL